MARIICVAAKLREANFGRPQPEDITHMTITRIPTSKHQPVYVRVKDRQPGSYWSDQPGGRSGYWWQFTAELPAQFDGLRLWDDEAQTGDFTANLAQELTDPINGRKCIV